MENFDDILEQVIQSPRGRKQKRLPGKSARAIAKRVRHSGDEKTPVISCNHNNHSVCVAASLSAEDLFYIKGHLYSSPDKVRQDAILLSYMDIHHCKRRRGKVDDVNKQKARDVSVKDYLLKEDKKRVNVCKSSFLSILCVNKDRVSNIAKYWLTNGVARPELRGGARNVEDKLEKRREIQGHVKTFTCRASHYTGRGAPGRKYLPSDLCVKRMHQLFLDQNHRQCSYSLYYSVFCYDFNLGFGHPAKDVCSECLKFKLRLKDPQIADEAKRKEAIMFMLHRRRAMKFYDTMNDLGDSFTVCFDIMENLVLPKTAIGQAYYSRQLYLYVFGVVRHRGRGRSQGKEDIDLYVWMEQENLKDSNMVASALNHYFCHIAKDELCQMECLRLFSDSCYGQNKNMSVLAMLCSLRKQTFPTLSIEYTFPVRGHSFLPADRAFDRIEQDIRKNKTILLPQQCVTILERHGTVHRYGEEWLCYEFKDTASEYCQSKRSFKISEAKSLRLDNTNPDKIGFKQVYNGDFCYHSVQKRGKKWEQYKPAIRPNVNCVKAQKKDDVIKLLAELGVNAEVDDYYTHALSNIEQEHGRQDLDSGEDE